MSTEIFVLLGALAGLILHVRARAIARFVPPAALVLVAVGMFMPIDLPTFVPPALVGAGAVVSVLGLGVR